MAGSRITTQVACEKAALRDAVAVWLNLITSGARRRRGYATTYRVDTYVQLTIKCFDNGRDRPPRQTGCLRSGRKRRGSSRARLRPAEGKATLQEIQSATGNDKLKYYNADFTSRAAVRQLAEEVCAQHNPLDVLINNAGIGAGPRGRPTRGKRGRP
ncbi:MAG: SDR family NAD(P)-dependent oxidoreductase [Pseudomonadota bacterium]|nr:SDR family NAD(P)-dependent oxidoreductase [Pseudomonadota bacterium]